MIVKLDLFISYYHEDGEFVKDLYKKLKAKKINVWYDRKMVKGQEISNEIKEKIKNSMILLLILSKKTIYSSWVPGEISIAQECKTPIIPYFIEEVTLSSFISDAISKKNQIRAYEFPMHENISEIIKVLKFHQDKSYYICKSKDLIERGMGKISVDKFLEEAVLIDKDYYGEYAGKPDICLSWIKSNPEIYILLFTEKTDTLIGYINAMPLDEEGYQKIKSGNQIDTFINSDAIESYGLPGIYHLYFCSIAIKKSYANEEGPYRLLFNAFLDLLIALAENRGIYFEEIAADAWTHSGERLAKPYMKPEGKNHHNDTETNVYVVPMLPPKFQPKGQKMKKVFRLYEEKAKELHTD